MLDVHSTIMVIRVFEFELMTRYGFSPAGALLSATKVNSELLKLQNQIGTIQPGKLADIVGFDKIHWKIFLL